MIDLHCDTASRLYYEGGKLKENKFSVDIKKLKTGKVSGQVFAHFIELDNCKNPYEEFLNMHNNFLKEINENKDSISIVTNVDELKIVNIIKKASYFYDVFFLYKK